MSIKVYTGLQGSGKSYEVVSVVILGAIREGRRVVSNIAGLQYEVMRAYLIAEGIDPANIGTILQVTHEDILKPNFFRNDTDDETKTETIVQGGDVVVIDEIWRFWDTDKSVTQRHQNFFRMHRHLLHPDSGLSCEIVLITQEIGDVCRKVKRVVEKTYLMSKLTELGLDKFYRVDIYSRATVTKSTQPINSLQKKYNPEIFNFYKSHSAGGDVVDPQEKSVDKRGNIFSRPIFKYGIPFSLLLCLPAFYFLSNFFSPKVAPSVSAAVSNSNVSNSPLAPSIKSNAPDVSLTWRIVGHYKKSDGLIFLIQNNQGEIRQLINPPIYQFNGLGSSVKMPTGEFISSWTIFPKIKQGAI